MQNNTVQISQHLSTVFIVSSLRIKKGCITYIQKFVVAANINAFEPVFLDFSLCFMSEYETEMRLSFLFHSECEAADVR